MSDKYQIDGVTISHSGGGYYELTHSSLSEPVKVRGKEDAEAKAKEIAAADAPTDGTMSPQGDLPPSTQAAVDAHVGQVEAVQQAKEDEKSKDEDKEKDDQIAALKAQLAEAQAEKDELAKAAENIRTVVVDQDAPPPPAVAVSQQKFEGKLDPETKKELKSLGVGTTTIILEESPDIPPTGLFLGHNFRGYMIKPGEPVDVPDFLIGVLDDAVTSTPIVDQTTKKVLGYRSRSKYPYRRV